MNILLLFLALVVADESAERNSGNEAFASASSKEFAVPQDTVDNVRAFLPSGWRVQTEPGLLIVRREGALRVQRILPGAPVVEADEPNESIDVEHYEITLRCHPAISREQHATQAKDLNKLIGCLRKSMKAFRVQQPTKLWPPYAPRNANEISQVKELKQLLKSQEELPDFVDHRVSLDIHDSLGLYGYIVGDNERAECSRMLKTIKGLFHRYDQGDATTDLQRIRGEWEVVSLVASGKPIEAARGRRFVFGQNEWRVIVRRKKPDVEEKRTWWTVSRTYSLSECDELKCFDEKHKLQYKSLQQSATRGYGVLEPTISEIAWFRKGIYKMEGDRLTICLGNERIPKSEALRPGEFASKTGDGRSLIVLLRRK